MNTDGDPDEEGMLELTNTELWVLIVPLFPPEVEFIERDATTEKPGMKCTMPFAIWHQDN